MGRHAALNQETITAIITTITEYRKQAKIKNIHAISTSHSLSYQEFRAILFWLHHNFKGFDVMMVDKRYQVTLPI